MLKSYDKSLYKEVNNKTKDKLNEFYRNNDPETLKKFYEQYLQTSYKSDPRKAKFAGLLLVKQAALIEGCYINEQKLSAIADAIVGQQNQQDKEKYMDLLFGMADNRALLAGDLAFVKGAYRLLREKFKIDIDFSITQLIDINRGSDKSLYKNWSDFVIKTLEQKKTDEYYQMKPLLEDIQKEEAQIPDWLRDPRFAQYAEMFGKQDIMPRLKQEAGKENEYFRGLAGTEAQKQELLIQMFISPEINASLVDLDMVDSTNWKTVISKQNEGFALRDVLEELKLNAGKVSDLSLNKEEKYKKIKPGKSINGERWKRVYKFHWKSLFKDKKGIEDTVKQINETRNKQISAYAVYMVSKFAWDKNISSMSKDELYALIKEEGKKLVVRFKKKDIRNIAEEMVKVDKSQRLEKMEEKDQDALKKVVNTGFKPGEADDAFLNGLKKDGMVRITAVGEKVIPVFTVTDKSLSKETVISALKLFLSLQGADKGLIQEAGVNVYIRKDGKTLQVGALNEFVNTMFGHMTPDMIDAVLAELFENYNDVPAIKSRLEENNKLSDADLVKDKKLFIDWVARKEGRLEAVRLFNIDYFKSELGKKIKEERYVDVSQYSDYKALIDSLGKEFAKKETVTNLDVWDDFKDLNRALFEKEMADEKVKDADKIAKQYAYLVSAQDAIIAKQKLDKEIKELPEEQKDKKKDLEEAVKPLQKQIDSLLKIDELKEIIGEETPDLDFVKKEIAKLENRIKSDKFIQKLVNVYKINFAVKDIERVLDVNGEVAKLQGEIDTKVEDRKEGRTDEQVNADITNKNKEAEQTSAQAVNNMFELQQQGVISKIVKQDTKDI
ncbi:hypothetical protein KKC59_02610, partial [bacterium]|nr:hypothetical protein [bacterium]